MRHHDVFLESLTIKIDYFRLDCCFKFLHLSRFCVPTEPMNAHIGVYESKCILQFLELVITSILTTALVV